MHIRLAKLPRSASRLMSAVGGSIPRSTCWRAGALALVLAAALSGCDEKPSTVRPAPTVSASAAIAPPAVTLTPKVSSKAHGAWPKQTKAFDEATVAKLLPPTEGGRIELLDAGIEPHAVRRYQLTAGDKRTLELELDLGMKVKQGDETTIPPVPALSIEVALETTVVKNDIAELTMTIAKASIRSRGETDKEVIEQLGPLVEKLPGIKAGFRVTGQGIRTRTPEPPKDTPPELRQLWTSVGEAVSDAIIAFPNEPIGPGAKWTVIDRQKRAGVTMLRKTQLTLLDVSDGAMRLSGEVVEGAIAGSAHDPSLPKGVSIEVLEGVTVGKRRHTFRAGELWPLASSTELSSDLQLKGTAKLGQLEDVKISDVKITQILRAVRSDAGAAGKAHAPPGTLDP